MEYKCSEIKLAILLIKKKKNIFIKYNWNALFAEAGRLSVKNVISYKRFIHNIKIVSLFLNLGRTVPIVLVSLSCQRWAFWRELMALPAQDILSRGSLLPPNPASHLIASSWCNVMRQRETTQQRWMWDIKPVSLLLLPHLPSCFVSHGGILASC